MHHPLSKELFQAHVIVQHHLEESALGGGGETGRYPEEMAPSQGGRPHPRALRSCKPGRCSCKRRLLGAGFLPSALTLMGPSRMICPSLAMLSYSWMAARR